MPDRPVSATVPTDTQDLEALAKAAVRLREQVSRRVVGQPQVVDLLLTALFAGGHGLFVGVPGLAKTLLVSTLAEALALDFSRIQFTPDLMPADITGSEILEEDAATGKRQFRFVAGPVFCNLLLADEINRTPPKTQAALLQAMQEGRVSAGGKTHRLPPPFHVFATQNPIEQEGTYPLPEAQLDRFVMKIIIDYPDHAAEEQIVAEVTTKAAAKGLDAKSVFQVCDPFAVINAQQECANIQAVPEVVKYAVNICRATREAQGISLGAGTRGAISLVQVAKSYALMQGRGFVTPDDIKSATLPVLRHRVQLAPELAISGQHIDAVLSAIVNDVEAPRV